MSHFNFQLSEREFIVLLQLLVTKQKITHSFESAIRGGKKMIQKLTIPVESSSSDPNPIIKRKIIIIDRVSFQFLKGENFNSHYDVSPFVCVSLDQLSCIYDTLENEQNNISIEIQELQVQDQRKQSCNRIFKNMMSSCLQSNEIEIFSKKSEPQMKLECAIPPAECVELRVVLNHLNFIVVPDFWAQLIPLLLPFRNHLKRYQNIIKMDSASELKVTQRDVSSTLHVFKN